MVLIWMDGASDILEVLIMGSILSKFKKHARKAGGSMGYSAMSDSGKAGYNRAGRFLDSRARHRFPRASKPKPAQKLGLSVGKSARTVVDLPGNIAGGAQKVGKSALRGVKRFGAGLKQGFAKKAEFMAGFADELDKLALNYNWKSPKQRPLTLGKSQTKSRKGMVGRGSLATNASPNLSSSLTRQSPTSLTAYK